MPRKVPTDPARRQGGLQGVPTRTSGRGSRSRVAVISRASSWQRRSPIRPKCRASSTSPPISEGRTDPTRGGRIVSRSRTARLEVVHPQAEARIVVGVPPGEGQQRFPRLRRVVPAGQRPPVPERGEGAVERLQLQPVPREIEVVHDLRAQQADHIGEDGDREPRQDLLAESGPTHPLVLLDEDGPPPAPAPDRRRRSARCVLRRRRWRRIASRPEPPSRSGRAARRQTAHGRRGGYHRPAPAEPPPARPTGAPRCRSRSLSL